VTKYKVVIAKEQVREQLENLGRGVAAPAGPGHL